MKASILLPTVLSAIFLIAIACSYVSIKNQQEVTLQEIRATEKAIARTKAEKNSIENRLSSDLSRDALADRLEWLNVGLVPIPQSRIQVIDAEVFDRDRNVVTARVNLEGLPGL
ncbi:MAG: hypothetical protein AAF555_02625 [Verrucomicrobiota bacterium]